ncbi:MAG: Ycf48-like protein precursor [Syntrophorhabdus sp. PtaU1.Bin153]|nr:MAG: Ycf48-like protein precursor [Syntrophorhabdus sp. PtaU1.Bin153]
MSCFKRRIARKTVLVMVCVFLAGFFAVELPAKGKKAPSHGVRGRQLGVTPYDLFSVTFPTENNGWACGRWGTIVSTDDGGKTWKTQTSGTDYTLASISFVDSNTGWAVGDASTILHTNDGGKSWTKQKSPEQGNFFMGVCFVNRKKGWIVGERTTILGTEDGGATWTVQSKDAEYLLKSVSFADENTGWAAGEYGYIYHTNDGGKSWKHQAGKWGISEETGDVVAENYIFRITALSPHSAMGVGIDGYMVSTNDAGKTWKPLRTDIMKTHLFGLAHQNGRLAVGGAGLLSSGAVGANKFGTAKAEPPVIYGYIYDITTKGKEGFVAVGKEGWVYLSDTTGTAWHIAGSNKN